MEFTEVQELNNIAFQARSFMPGQFFAVEKAAPSNYGALTTQTMVSTLMFDYEKVLEDTPPNSPSKYLPAGSPETIKMLHKDKEESVEDLLFNIKNSIIEYTNINDFSIKPSIVEKQPSVTIREESASPVGKYDEFEQRDGEVNRTPLQFEKITEDYVSKSYMETKNLKSFLSSSIKAFPSNKEYNTNRRAEMKTFKVYFLSEKHSTLLPISFAIPIRDIVKQCLETFKMNKAMSDELIKYPDRPDAYDLQRDLTSGPLEKQKTLKDVRIGRELFVVESKGFDASKPYTESSKNDSDNKNTPAVVILYLPTEDRAKVIIQMSADRQLKEVFSRLALEGKTGYNIQQYNVRPYSSDPEIRWKEAKNYLDVNIPLKNIKQAGQEAIQLELVKKKFADEPDLPIDERISSPIKKSGTFDLGLEDNQQIILYNEVSANHYEEFEVTKINETGRRQERILGIDGFKLYNYTKSYKQEQAGRIGEMFNALFFSKFGTMNPERLLSDVNEAKSMGSKVFQISVKSEGKSKWLHYEAADSKIASQIVAKINYLKGIQQKKNI